MSLALRPLLTVALGASLLVFAGGCWTRRVLTIDTEPSGARIWVDGVEQDERTPIEVPFVHYGWFEVRVEKEGYASVATELHVGSRIDGYPVVDLPFELMVPRREFTRTIPLEPLPPEPGEAEVDSALERARSFRERAREAARESDTPERMER